MTSVLPENERSRKPRVVEGMQPLLDRWGLDLRSLALLRIGLAVLLLVTVRDQLMVTGSFSEPAASTLGTLWATGLSVAAVAMLLGFYSRLATVSAWLLLVVVSQNPLIIFCPTSVLQSIMLWAMFLPLGAAYSVDRAMNTATRPIPLRFLSVATFALMVQQLINFSTVLNPPLKDGLFALGFGWLFLTVTCLAFIPTRVWERWSKSAYSFKGQGMQRTGLQIFYDADCGFCKKVVHLIRMLLVLPHTPLATAQSLPAIHQAMETQNSWVIVDWQGNHHYRFEAIAYVVSLSPVFHPLAPILRWKPVMAMGTRFYKWVANHRKVASRFTRPFKFKPLIVRNPIWLNGLAVGLIGVRLLVK
ncbi:MAG: DCC1-like thiol-disulfide oxidoreductase family protein [Phormidesmis sp.]